MAAADRVREVRFPDGWAGPTIKMSQDGRFFIQDVPAAPRQVEDVHEGDEVVTINGERPRRLAERITCPGDQLNACSSARPPHEVGAVGKFHSPPCDSCDFARRQKRNGLDAAIMLWIKARKQDTSITFGLCTPPVVLKPREHSSQRGRVDLSSSSASGAMQELRSLNELARERGLSSSSASGGMQELKSLNELAREQAPTLKPNSQSQVKLTPRPDWLHRGEGECGITLKERQPEADKGELGHREGPIAEQHVKQEPVKEPVKESTQDILDAAARLPPAGEYVKLLSWDLEAMEADIKKYEAESQAKRAAEISVSQQSVHLPSTSQEHERIPGLAPVPKRGVKRTAASTLNPKAARVAQSSHPTTSAEPPLAPVASLPQTALHSRNGSPNGAASTGAVSSSAASSGAAATAPKAPPPPLSARRRPTLPSGRFKPSDTSTTIGKTITRSDRRRSGTSAEAASSQRVAEGDRGANRSGEASAHGAGNDNIARGDRGVRLAEGSRNSSPHFVHQDIDRSIPRQPVPKSSLRRSRETPLLSRSRSRDRVAASPRRQDFLARVDEFCSGVRESRPAEQADKVNHMEDRLPNRVPHPRTRAGSQTASEIVKVTNFHRLRNRHNGARSPVARRRRRAKR